MKSTRRSCIATTAAFSAGVIFAPAIVCARPFERPVRLGYLTGGSRSETNLAAVQLGLSRLGWQEDRDFVLHSRFADLDLARLPALAAELLAAHVQILITAGPAARVIPAVQHHVPVVFAYSGDPVSAGLVASYARPGGNATGITQLSFELAAKRLELLREIAPTARQVAVLWSPLHPGEEGERRATEQAATRLGFELARFSVRNASDVEAALIAGSDLGCDSLTAFPDPVTLANRRTIVEHARQRTLPSLFGRREFVDAGGLASYGPNLAETYARTAYFIERIAAGLRPAQIPVETPAVLETILNRTTARALNVRFSQALLLRADEIVP